MDKDDNYPKVSYYTTTAAAKSIESLPFQSLQQAISNCAIPLVHQLIQQTPSLVHEKGWHGQTALHKACLTGDWTICFLLLEAGSDPNALNDFRETPVHYASKRGLAPVIHLLAQRKGDLTALDKNGMSCSHHCALTGNVYAFMYLEHQGSSLRELDRNLQSPLHIVCQYGHVDAFKYLMRKERSKLDQTDADGNTPLHVAAREGQSHLCWLILIQTGCSNLHAQNRAGFTPLDLVNQRDKVGHKIITPVLQYYSKKDRNHVPSGPVWLWYWLLILPGVVYGALVVLALLSGTRYQGLIILIGMLALLFFISRNVHRIDHPSRWPNPLYAGTFAAGLLHTIILYTVQVLPYTKYHTFVTGMLLLGGVGLVYFYWRVLTIDPDTHYSMTLTTVNYVLSIILLYFYIRVLRKDPGEVKESVNDKETGRPLTILDLCVPHRKIEMLCFTCEITRSSWTKHCKLCDKCYQRMDHHCLFLLKCIAKNNHSQFIWFIIYVLICMFVFLFSVLLYCCDVYADKGLVEILPLLFCADGWVLSMVCMHFASIFWGVNLLRYQFGLIAKGHTTVFRTQGEESVLTANEKLLNVIYFLMGREPFAEDPIVFQFV